VIALLTPIQTTIWNGSRHFTIRGRVWGVTWEESPRYSILPDGKQSLGDSVHDVAPDRIQVIEAEEVQPIRLVKV
jgi:hypothetical protein